LILEDGDRFELRLPLEREEYCTCLWGREHLFKHELAAWGEKKKRGGSMTILETIQKQSGK